jgi:hypothetical protein
MKPVTKISILLLASSPIGLGADALTYQKPPKAILDVLNSAPTPILSLNPTRTYATQGAPLRNPPIAELAQPMLRLAGLRINPRSNGLHNTIFNASLSLRKIPDGTEIKLDLHPNPRLGPTHWSPDGTRFAFTNATSSSTELWIGDAATGKAHRVEGVRINAVMAGGGPGGGGGRGAFAGNAGPSDVQWMPDGKSLLVEIVKPNRGAPPAEPVVPTGPHVQESLGDVLQIARAKQGDPTLFLSNPVIHAGSSDLTRCPRC